MVFKVFTQDEVLCSALASRPLSLQFQVVVFLGVFKVYTQDKARCSVLWSRMLTFQFLVVVAKIFSQFLVQAFSRTLWRSSLRVFCTFPRVQKSAPVAASPSARVYGHSSSCELSAHQILRAGVSSSHQFKRHTARCNESLGTRMRKCVHRFRVLYEIISCRHFLGDLAQR